MALQFRALEDSGSTLSTHMAAHNHLQLQGPPPDLRGHHACTWFTDIHTNKVPINIKNKNKRPQRSEPLYLTILKYGKVNCRITQQLAVPA